MYSFSNLIFIDYIFFIKFLIKYRRDNNEGLNRWLAGEGLMTDVEAAQILVQRSRLYLHSSLRSFVALENYLKFLEIQYICELLIY